MKKVLFAIGTMEHGGTESQLLHLIKSLSKKNICISVFLLESKGPLLNELKSQNIKLYEGKFVSDEQKLVSYYRFFKSFFYLLYILSTKRFSFIQSYLPLMNFLCVIAGTLTFHKVWTGWRGMTSHQIAKPYFIYLDSISNLLSCGINSNAQAILEDKSKKEKFMSFRKSLVIPNYVPRGNIINISSEILELERNKFNVKQKDILLFCVSNLIQYKGHVDLLNALKILPKKYKLIFAGRDDGLLAKLNELIKDNNLEDRVRYLGYCNKDELNVYYQVADIYVCPSHTEGISNSIIEALIYELRVVATDVGGNNELLEYGKFGFICKAFDPEDLAEKILIAAKNTENKSIVDKDYIQSKYSEKNMLDCYFSSWRI